MRLGIFKYFLLHYCSPPECLPHKAADKHFKAKRLLVPRLSFLVINAIFKLLFAYYFVCWSLLFTNDFTAVAAWMETEKRNRKTKIIAYAKAQGSSRFSWHSHVNKWILHSFLRNTFSFFVFCFHMLLFLNTSRLALCCWQTSKRFWEFAIFTYETHASSPPSAQPAYRGAAWRLCDCICCLICDAAHCNGYVIRRLSGASEAAIL